MHKPDFYLVGTPLYVHPWVTFGEFLMMSGVPDFPPTILLASADTMGWLMMENLAKTYWPEGVQPEWVRL